MRSFITNTKPDSNKDLLLHRELTRLVAEWPDDDLHPHYIRVIAGNCGWKPLAVGESMTVGFQGEEYTITRNKDRYTRTSPESGLYSNVCNGDVEKSNDCKEIGE